MALVEVSRADDGERGALLNVTSPGRAALHNWWWQLQRWSTDHCRLDAAESAIIACLRRLWVAHVPEQVVHVEHTYTYLVSWFGDGGGEEFAMFT